MTVFQEKGASRNWSLLSGSALYLFSNVIAAAIPFLLLPVLTRFLSPEQYGEVAMFQTLVAALSAIVGLNVVSAASRKYYDGDAIPAVARQFNGTCMQILLVSTFAALCLVALTQSQLSIWLGLQHKWVLWAVPMAAFGVVIQLRLGQWQVRSQAVAFGVLQVSLSLLSVGFTLLLVILYAQGADGRIVALLAASGLCAVVALILLVRDKLIAFWGWDSASWKEALQFGVPLIPHVAGLFLLASVDRFVVNAELGIAEAGIYMVAVQLATAVSLVFDAINKAYVPWLFERLKRDVPAEKRRIVLFTYVWFVAILVGSATAFILGPPVVRIVAGDAYASAGNVIGWLALGHGFGGMYLMVTNYVFYSKRTALLSMVSVTSGLLNVLLLLLLTHRWGIQGAAIAFCLSMAFRFVQTWWVAQRRHPMPWFNFNVQV